MSNFAKCLLTVSLVTAGALGAFLAVAQTSVSAPAEASASDVQAYIEANQARLVKAGATEQAAYQAVVADALKVFPNKPELIASALLSLKFEPPQVALLMVSTGLSKTIIASAVITAAGTPTAEAVKAVLLLNATPSEIRTITEAVVAVVAKLTPATKPADASTQVASTTKATTTEFPVLPTEPTGAGPAADTGTQTSGTQATGTQTTGTQSTTTQTADVPLTGTQNTGTQNLPTQTTVVPPSLPVVVPTAPSTGGRGTTRS